MIIQPKTRGFICTTAHPVGCAAHVEEQIRYAKAHPRPGAGRVLVIGSSMGYGLAARIAAAFCGGAATVGVSLERAPSGRRTATAGWYNNRAFLQQAENAGLVAENIDTDAFSDAGKAQTIERIQRAMPGGQVDLVIYSLAAPRRTDPETGEEYASVIKPVGEVFTGTTVDFHTGEVSQVEIAPASDSEIRQTVAVMGGDDWQRWIRALLDAGVLAEGAATLAFSYIGPEQTHAIYKNGTIGRAKEHLEHTAEQISAWLAPRGGRAFVTVNKALVTQSSAAIPVVPLYISLLFRVMKQRGTHEGCIEQMVRLFEERLYPQGRAADWRQTPVDAQGRIRMDDWEMHPEVQQAVARAWPQVTTQNIEQIADLAGYRDEFFRLFGFGIQGVDYTADVALD